MSEKAPTQVIIDGGDSRLSHLLVRAAAERDDVVIKGVIIDPDARQGFEDFYVQVNHDSIYGGANISDLGMPFYELGSVRAEILMDEAKESNDIVVVTEHSVQKYLTSHKPTFNNGVHLLNNLIVGDKKAWGTKDGQARSPVTAVPPTAPVKRSDKNPHYVPDARLSAIIPIMGTLEEAFGLSALRVTELRSYSADQSLTDQTSPVRTAEQSRAATQGVIERDISADWRSNSTLDVIGLFDPSKLLARFERKLNERSFSVPAQVGTVAVFSADLQDRFTTGYLHQALEETDGLVIERDLVSSADVRGRSEAGIVSHYSLRQDGQIAEFVVMYDSDWSRTHRVLDAAVEIAAS